MAAGLFGISEGWMSDIFHKWAQLLDDALKEMFSQPTWSDTLRTHPVCFIEADWHACCSLLLDAFEVFTQQSSNNNVASSVHSDYKQHCTVKFLGGCDNVECTWDGTIPNGNPGRMSDVTVPMYTKILHQVPFGFTCKVGKGFIIDNNTFVEGVVIDRPQKCLKKQKHQTSVDISQTQKIGNSCCAAHG